MTVALSEGATDTGVGTGVGTGVAIGFGVQNLVYFGAIAGKERSEPLPSYALMRNCASFAAQVICDH